MLLHDPRTPNELLVLALISIVGLVVLIARFRFNAFVALLIASLFLGITSGMSLPDVTINFDEGLGKTLKALGMVIALGTILGKLLAESGGAEVIATQMVHWLGVKRLDYAMMLMGFLIGISVFFGVGVVLLGPIAFTLARETRTPILRLALPMAAGLSTAHGLIPPHPGPMTAIAMIHADVGKTIFWSLLFGLPTALVTGPLLARWVTPHVPLEMGGLGALSTGSSHTGRRPSFTVTIVTMLLPVILMLIGTAADVTLLKENPLRQWADFFGTATVALLVAVLVAMWTFGRRCGFAPGQILKFSEECLAPAAMLFVVIGAGGGFSAVLNASGVANAIRDSVGHGISPLVLGWTIAGLLRISVGSATVAITIAAQMMEPLVQSPGYHVNKELLVLSMGAGSLILSHVNDSGFWFVKEYLGMSVGQTLRTWTVVETGIACTSLVLILLANLVVG